MPGIGSGEQASPLQRSFQSRRRRVHDLAGTSALESLVRRFGSNQVVAITYLPRYPQGARVTNLTAFFRDIRGLDLKRIAMERLLANSPDLHFGSRARPVSPRSARSMNVAARSAHSTA